MKWPATGMILNDSMFLTSAISVTGQQNIIHNCSIQAAFIMTMEGISLAYMNNTSQSLLNNFLMIHLLRFARMPSRNAVFKVLLASVLVIIFLGRYIFQLKVRKVFKLFGLLNVQDISYLFFYIHLTGITWDVIVSNFPITCFKLLVLLFWYF